MRTNRLFALALSMSLMAFSTLQPLLAEDGGLKSETPQLGGGPAATTTGNPSTSTTDGLKSETPEVAPPNSAKASSLFPTPAERKTGETSLLQPETPKTAVPQEEKPAPAPVAAPKKSTMLYGRIEQLTAGAGASFPLLAPMKAKMDPREQLLKAGAQDNMYSGSVVKSFPSTYQGIWGGSMKVWSSQVAPLSYQLDRSEATYTARIMRPGLEGNVNFDFEGAATGKISLAPAHILFSVPAGDTATGQQAAQMWQGMGAGGGAMGQMMQQYMSSMQVPIVLYFGAHQEDGVMSRNVGGGIDSVAVVKNTLRELKPGVLEQQIVTKNSSRSTTGAINNGYAEHVIRFIKQNDSQMSVQAASVNYTSSGQFLSKFILYGYVNKGQMTNNTPNSAIMPMPTGGQAGGQMPQIPGMPDMNQLMRMMQGGQGGQGGANPFKGLF